jgi:hypothetical protein
VVAENDYSWIVKDAKVWVYETFASDRRPQLHTIESVAPKSFVVNGTRHRKDTPVTRVGGAYGKSYRVEPDGTELAQVLRAEWTRNRRQALARKRAEEFRDQRLGQGTAAAMAALRAMQAYLEAEQLYALARKHYGYA